MADTVARWIDAGHLDVLPRTGTRRLITAASVRRFAGEANPIALITIVAKRVHGPGSRLRARGRGA